MALAMSLLVSSARAESNDDWMKCLSATIPSDERVCQANFFGAELALQRGAKEEAVRLFSPVRG